MPGDWGATDPVGNGRVMESWGAGTVDLLGGGHHYNLRPGATATLTIPIHSSQLAFPAAIAPTIPLLTYDEKAGLWRQEGVANRVGNTYVGKVKHFSAFNMDQLKVGQACVRLETTLMPDAFDLEVTIPSSGGGAATVVTKSVTNQEQRFHVIYNLETNQDIELRAFEKNGNPIEVRQPPPSPAVEALEVNTGGAQDPTDPNEPEFPYEACQVSVELTPDRLPPATTDLFLAGRGSFTAANLTELDVLDPDEAGLFLAAAEAYYDTVDPKGFRRDLTDFKDRNGFPAGEIVAKYANSGDLGFGRDMHCRKSGADVACYVTNYGSRFTDDDQDLDDANANVQPGGHGGHGVLADRRSGGRRQHLHHQRGRQRLAGGEVLRLRGGRGEPRERGRVQRPEHQRRPRRPRPAPGPAALHGLPRRPLPKRQHSRRADLGPR